MKLSLNVFQNPEKLSANDFEKW